MSEPERRRLCQPGPEVDVPSRAFEGGNGTEPCIAATATAEAATSHDPRCVRLTSSEFNGSCDCRTWKLIDANSEERGMKHWVDLADRLTRDVALRAVPGGNEDDE